MRTIERNEETGRINALPEEIVLDPMRDGERAWRAKAAPLYDELDHENQVAWALACSTRMLEAARERYPDRFETSYSAWERASLILGIVEDGHNCSTQVINLVKSAQHGESPLGAWAKCLEYVATATGPFDHPGVGVASWCQVLGDDADAEREWQMERLRELGARS